MKFKNFISYPAGSGGNFLGFVMNQESYEYNKKSNEYIRNRNTNSPLVYPLPHIHPLMSTEEKNVRKNQIISYHKMVHNLSKNDNVFLNYSHFPPHNSDEYENVYCIEIPEKWTKYLFVLLMIKHNFGKRLELDEIIKFQASKKSILKNKKNISSILEEFDIILFNFNSNNNLSFNIERNGEFVLNYLNSDNCELTYNDFEKYFITYIKDQINYSREYFNTSLNSDNMLTIYSKKQYEPYKNENYRYIDYDNFYFDFNVPKIFIDKYDFFKKYTEINISYIEQINNIVNDNQLKTNIMEARERICNYEKNIFR